MEDFVKALPAFRKKSIEYLKARGWNRKGSRPCVHDPDEWHRIGNASYAKRNQTYGLTTLRRKHVDIENTS
jgi:DNA topoisomerase-1